MNLTDLEREIRDEVGSLVPSLIAGILGIEVSEVAVAIGFDEADPLASYRSGDVQAKLKVFRDTCFGLVFFECYRDSFTNWLRSPSDELPPSGAERMRPLDEIRIGKPQWLAGWIQDALYGSPN